MTSHAQIIIDWKDILRNLGYRSRRSGNAGKIVLVIIRRQVSASASTVESIFKSTCFAELLRSTLLETRNNASTSRNGDQLHLNTSNPPHGRQFVSEMNKRNKISQVCQKYS